jgi:hypothetical protein
MREKSPKCKCGHSRSSHMSSQNGTDPRHYGLCRYSYEAIAFLGYDPHPESPKCNCKGFSRVESQAECPKCGSEDTDLGRHETLDGAWWHCYICGHTWARTPNPDGSLTALRLVEDTEIPPEERRYIHTKQ